MRDAAERREYEQAARERNRLRAMRSLLERQRIDNDARGHRSTSIAPRSTAPTPTSQVFQLRDGVLADRQSFYLRTRASASSGRSPRSSSPSTTPSGGAIPAQVIVQPEVDEEEPRRSASRC